MNHSFESPGKSLEHDDVTRLAEMIIRWAEGEPVIARPNPLEFIAPLSKEELAISSRTHFSSDEIASDLRDVAGARAMFKKLIGKFPGDYEKLVANKKRADALEIIIAFWGETMGWFGGALLARTSEYDDIKNGVDIVMEIELGGGEERIAFAIDASMASKEDVIKNKIDGNVEKVLHGEKSEVKYFKSPKDGRRASLSMIIPVVIGVDGRHTDELIIETVQALKFRNTGNRLVAGSLRGSEVLENHPCQMAFLEEAVSQLEMYLFLLAEKKDARYVKPISTITTILAYLKDVLSEKTKAVRSDISLNERTDDYLSQDAVLGFLRRNDKKLKK